jgi:hypothetical protein
MSELEKRSESTTAKKPSSRKRSAPSGGVKRKAASSKPAARKKAPAGRVSSAKKAAARAGTKRVARSISADERIRMISEAAYYRAEQRDFRGGDPERDWLEAEAEVDALLLRTRSGNE